MKKQRTKRRSRATNPPVRPPLDNVVTIDEFVSFLLRIKQSNSVSVSDDFLVDFLENLYLISSVVAITIKKNNGRISEELNRYLLNETLKSLMKEVENPSQHADDIKPFQD